MKFREFRKNKKHVFHSLTSEEWKKEKAFSMKNFLFYFFFKLAKEIYRVGTKNQGQPD